MATHTGHAQVTHNATAAVIPPPVRLSLVVGPAQCSRVGARRAGRNGPVGGVGWLGLCVGVPSAMATHIGHARATHNATTAVTPPPVRLCLVVGPA